MPAISINKLLMPLVFLLTLILNSVFAQEFITFQGEINGNFINVRSDSTVSAESICQVNKGERVEVIAQIYDWYKIRLPESASVFIKQGLATPIDIQSARVSKDNVNIRLKADESSSVIGTAQKDEIISVIRDKGEWYEIKPTNNSFGWIHKKFVHKINTIAKAKDDSLAEKTKEPDASLISIEGLLKTYGRVFKRVATHKLIAKDKKIFLLKGDKENLNLLNNQRVKIVGKLNPEVTEKYPVIEIEKVELLE